ncbi:facilitated trehalose transporter Tret1-like isoform X2 [Belonocnema kinseyi]|uniref:facilitated trehalose transporter Tret1-like isoform X1 n=1 Tax=Belonocnema kinseyi TaxID=2817044 RepID=UPI00143D9C7B|nr:facilitated trehalose transporter Tret1-like isoform X1 [Belonocnema kinseyi]XP_033229260.1 facilitated trehalose transporter Tret1-like isoform X2 [Belonocnema kinseyi]
MELNKSFLLYTFLSNGESESGKRIGDAKRRRAYFQQFISFLSGYILMMDVGSSMVWPSPALPYLTSENSTIPISNAQGALLAASMNISAIIALLLCPLVVDRIGIKYTIQVIGLLQLLSKILLYIADNYIFLLVTRLLTGIGWIAMYAFFPLYMGEIAAENVRGRFLIFDKICVNLGSFLMSIAGAFLAYNTMNLVMISIPLIAILLFPLMEETPYFHLIKGREEEAAKTLMRLSADNGVKNVKANIERMKNAILKGQISKQTSIRELFSDRASRRALIIKTIAETTYIFSGYHAVQAYAQEIFSYSGSNLAPGYSVMIMTGIQIFAGLPSSQIVDRWGRRPTFLLSGVSSALSLAIVGLFFFLKIFLQVDVSSIAWLPLAGLISFTFSCNMGLSTVPYVYKGELFSVKVKNVATTFSTIIASALGFTTHILFALLHERIGIYSSFWIFGLVCFVGSVTVFCIAPETKGKNLEEILELLSKKN